MNCFYYSINFFHNFKNYNEVGSPGKLSPSGGTNQFLRQIAYCMLNHSWWRWHQSFHPVISRTQSGTGKPRVHCVLWKLPVGFQERLQALSSLEGTISLSEKSPASNKNLLFPVLISLTAAENQEPKARRRAAGALQVASVPSCGRCCQRIPQWHCKLHALWCLLALWEGSPKPWGTRLNYLSERQQQYFAVMARLCTQVWITPSHESEFLGLMTHCVFYSER